ncbi:hypothetical protein Leryth_001835 [Lithospermum erythrorhizon]|nr:hypothetical protein Leryth_001835 [Lithospermum erythrorhizon]
MAVDPRHILAAVLTVTMCTFMQNHIKQTASQIKSSLVSSSTGRDGPWRGDGSALKQCWDKPVLDEHLHFIICVSQLYNSPFDLYIRQLIMVLAEFSVLLLAKYLLNVNNFVKCDLRVLYIDVWRLCGGVSGSDDAHSHVFLYFLTSPLQIADAVVVARYLRATLVLPDIRGIVKVPSQVTEDYLAENVGPVFRSKVACLAMFGSLELNSSSMQRSTPTAEPKTLSRKTNGQFISVDLRVDMLDKKGCQGNGAISGLFYANVAGKRIASGKTQILVPANAQDSSADFLSHYVTKKETNFVYLCFKDLSENLIENLQKLTQPIRKMGVNFFW